MNGGIIGYTVLVYLHKCINAMNQLIMTVKERVLLLYRLTFILMTDSYCLLYKHTRFYKT